MPEPCAIAVVVATYNRAGRLARLLEHLQMQEVPGGFEVVVVDDGSTDDTPAALANIAPSLRFPLRNVRLDRNGGPAAARNAGWHATTAPLVAFTDDDCMPTAGWLATLVEAIGEADIAQGMTIIDPRNARDIGPFGHTVEVLRETGFYETCNIAYRRSVLERLGGFDEAFRLPYGEDTDLAWRGRELGATTTFVPEAVVHHEVRPADFAGHIRELRRREGIVRAIKRHPQLRRSYSAGVFFSSTHPWALAWTVAAATVMRRPRSVSSWVGLAGASAGHAHATFRSRQGPARGRHWLAVLPLALASDIFEIGVLARASLRYRTLML